MADGYIRRSGDDYARALADLLPVGAAWPRDPQSVLMQLVSGLGQTWGQLDGRAYDLLEDETDPRFTDEMLSDWERAFGLPDGCVPTPTTVEGRRAALIAKMTAVGGQSRAYFVAIAAALGFTIRIVEWSPYQGGISRCGDTRPTTGAMRWLRGGTGRCGVDHQLGLPSDFAIVGPMRWRSGAPAQRAWWRVIVEGRTLRWFRAGDPASRAGRDPMLTFTPPLRWLRAGVGGGQLGIAHHLEVDRAADLECLFHRYKPAHSHVTFLYAGTPASAL